MSMPAQLQGPEVETPEPPKAALVPPGKPTKKPKKKRSKKKPTNSKPDRAGSRSRRAARTR